MLGWRLGRVIGFGAELRCSLGTRSSGTCSPIARGSLCAALCGSALPFTASVLGLRERSRGRFTWTVRRVCGACFTSTGAVAARTALAARAYGKCLTRSASGPSYRLGRCLAQRAGAWDAMMTPERATWSWASARMSAGHPAPDPAARRLLKAAVGLCTAVRRPHAAGRTTPPGFPRQRGEPFHVERSWLTACSTHDASRPGRRDTPAAQAGAESAFTRGAVGSSCPRRRGASDEQHRAWDEVMTRVRATAPRASSPIYAGHSAHDLAARRFPTVTVGLCTAVRRRHASAGGPQDSHGKGRDPFHVERSPLTPCSLHGGSARRGGTPTAARAGSEIAPPGSAVGSSYPRQVDGS